MVYLHFSVSSYVVAILTTDHSTKPKTVGSRPYLQVDRGTDYTAWWTQWELSVLAVPTLSGLPNKQPPGKWMLCFLREMLKVVVYSQKSN